MLEESVKVFIGKMLPQLDEKQRRLFLGGLSEMLGRGSVKELHELTKVSQVTIIDGKKECEKITPSPEARCGRTAGNTRMRAEGGGRKTATDKYPHVVDELELLVHGHAACCPEDPLCWTTKSLRNLEAALKEKNISISHVTVGSLLEGMGYSLRQDRKSARSGDPEDDRDAQFRFINGKARSFMQSKYPVISVDAKKKEFTDRHKNNGNVYFPSGQTGKASDRALNFSEGFANAGIGADTAEFAVSSIREWWKTMGSERYPGADRLYITADCGRSSGRRNSLWKTSLQNFADETKREVKDEDIWRLFKDEYLPVEESGATAAGVVVGDSKDETLKQWGRLKLLKVSVSSGEDGSDTVLKARILDRGVNVGVDEPVEREVSGIGNGPIAAFLNAVSNFGVEASVMDYVEHTMSVGTDAMAASYVECQIGEEDDASIVWGVGIDTSIVTSSLKAIISAINRSER